MSVRFLGVPTPQLSNTQISPEFSNGKSALTVRRLLEVDVRVAERTARDRITTDADRQDRSGLREFVVQRGLGDAGMKVANIERSHRILARSGGGSGGDGRSCCDIGGRSGLNLGGHLSATATKLIG